MAERTRPIRIEFCVTEQERRLIQNKMAQLGTRNMGAYLRKMAIDGYIIKVDYTQQKKLAAAVSRAASNINQICRRINSTGHFYLWYRFGFEDDVYHPLNETAKHFHLSESRAKSTEALALDNVWLELPWWY